MKHTYIQCLLAFAFVVMPFALAIGCNPAFTSSPMRLHDDPMPTGAFDEVCRIAIEVDDVEITDVAGCIENTAAMPWSPLCQSLTKAMDRPVQICPETRYQIEHHLQDGRIEFAIITREAFEVLAVDDELPRIIARSISPIDGALIVASADAPIETVDDVKGRRFAFGPQDDPLLDRGALNTLQNSGISEGDIASEWVPYAGARQHCATSAEAAKVIVYEYGTDVGVIARDFYSALPEYGGRYFHGAPTFSKDQFRILATVPAPVEIPSKWVVVANPTTPAHTREALRQALLGVDKHGIELADTLGIAGWEIESSEASVATNQQAP